jgi:hypothetical protein
LQVCVISFRSSSFVPAPLFLRLFGRFLLSRRSFCYVFCYRVGGDGYVDD